MPLKRKRGEGPKKEVETPRNAEPPAKPSRPSKSAKPAKAGAGQIRRAGGEARPGRKDSREFTELVLLVHANNLAEAELFKTELEAHGIPTILEGEGAGVAGIPDVGAGVPVLVPEEYADQAAELIAELESAKPEGKTLADKKEIFEEDEDLDEEDVEEIDELEEEEDREDKELGDEEEADEDEDADDDEWEEDEEDEWEDDEDDEDWDDENDEELDDKEDDR